MKKKLRKYQFGSQGLTSTPINPYTGFSPSISLQGPSSGLGMSKPLDYENDKPKTQLAPSSSLLNKPSLSPTPTSTPYTGISSKPIVSPAFTSTPSIASPQRYASASVKPEAGAPKTAFGATKTGLDQTKLQSSTTNMAPKTNTGATAAGGVASGLNAIGEGVNTYRKFNPVTAGSTSLYNKKEQNILKKINDERDAVTGLEATTAALGTAAGITAAIPVIGWGVGAGLGIAAAGTGIAAASTAASLDKQESTLFKRVSARAEREKREAEGLIKTQEIESMMNSSNPLEVQNEMIDIEEKPMRARMPAYQMGGPRNYAGPMEEPKPNAEVERGEVRVHPDGKIIVEKGNRHEENGNKVYLPPGAFVWSDHLKYQGKSMAQWFLMFKDNPERVEQLKALQENLASKEKPSKYNDLPKQKYGGELPKYQIEGSYPPEGSYNPANRYAYPDAIGNMVAEQKAKRAAYTSVPEEMSKDKNAKKSPKEESPRPTGVFSKTGTLFNKYGEYIAPTLATVGQFINLGLAKNPYENMKVPAANTIASPQQISLARTNAQAEMDANAAGTADAIRAGSEAGLLNSSYVQALANQQASLNSKAKNEADRINMGIAIQEADLNSKNALAINTFNADAKTKAGALGFERNYHKSAYEAAKTASYGNAMVETANAFQSFGRDRAVAKSITRGTNIDRNSYAMDVEALEKAARDEETANATKAGREFSQDEFLKLYTKKIGEASTYISKRD